MKREYTVQELYSCLDKFTEIYPEDLSLPENKMPNNIKLTVYCSNDGDQEGFIENSTSDELGLEALIARKWILQTDLDNLLES